MWKKKIEELLRNGMRFCFESLPKDFDEKGFSGEELSSGYEMGLLQHAQSIIEDERKRCYLSGYLQRAKEAQVGEVDQELLLTEKILAERRFHQFE